MISVILPWRGRPEELYRTVENLDHPGVEIVIVFDGESEEFRRFENSEYQAVVKKVLSPAPREFVGAVNLGWKEATGNLIMIWAADCLIDDPQWYEKVEANYKRNFPKGGGLLCADDGYWEGKIAIHPIIDRNFVEWIGYVGGEVLYPGYIHYGIDNELTERAKADGRYAYDPELKYSHPAPDDRNGYQSCRWKDLDRATLVKRRELWS